jgi:Protein of unknown function (DUF3813)
VAEAEDRAYRCLARRAYLAYGNAMGFDPLLEWDRLHEEAQAAWVMVAKDLVPKAPEAEAIALIRSAKGLLENAWNNPSRAERAILANLETALQKLDPERVKTEAEQDADADGDTYEPGA